MRSRTVLVVALAAVMALGGVYIGWSTSSPKAAADPTATPPPARPAREAGSGPSRSPAGHVPNAPPQQSNPPKGTPPKGTPPKGTPPAAPPPAQEPHHTGPVRFGQLTTAGRPNDTDVSPDRRGLTTAFEDFEVVLDQKSTEPDATKSFSMTLPLTDGAEGETLTVQALGFAFIDDGATARLTLKGGRRTIIKGFAPGSDESFVETLELPATPGRTYQLSAVIEIHRDADTEGQGYLNVAALNIGIN
jgi:hypothetical protein